MEELWNNIFKYKKAQISNWTKEYQRLFLHNDKLEQDIKSIDPALWQVLEITVGVRSPLWDNIADLAGGAQRCTKDNLRWVHIILGDAFHNLILVKNNIKNRASE